MKPQPGRVLALAAAACLAGYVYASTSGRAGSPIRSDAFSYYVYLPAWALYQDVSLQAVADDCCGGEFPDWTLVRLAGDGDARVLEAALLRNFRKYAHDEGKYTDSVWDRK